MRLKIVKDMDFLKEPCEAVTDFKEAEEIARDLLKFLDKTKIGVGIAANQIGINKRICVINVAQPMYFFNPVITGAAGSIKFREGCLSFPDVTVVTKRYRKVSVKADNFKSSKRFTIERNMLECICIQHEIDHLNGVTMFDRVASKKQKGEEGDTDGIF